MPDVRNYLLPLVIFSFFFG